MSLFRAHPFYTGSGNSLSAPRPAVGLIALIITGLLVWILLQAVQDRPFTPTLASKGTEVPARQADGLKKLQPNYGQLPLQFEQNQGQTDAEVSYLARGAGYRLFLTPRESIVALAKGPGDDAPGAVVRMQLAGSNPAPVMHGLSPLPGKVNYLMGREPGDWHTDIPTYAWVETRDVYPGIDLRYHGDHQQLEYDFIVHPGAAVETIRMVLSGAGGPTARSTG